MKLTLKNGDLKAALDALETLCTGVNRLPTLAALRASRTFRALGGAWATVDGLRNQLIKDHGEEKDGTFSVAPGSPGMAAFMAAWIEALGAESEVEVETLTVADIEAGWSREDGKKGPLDISPAELGNLRAVGILVETQEG